LITLVMIGVFGALGGLLEASRSSVSGVAGGIGFVAASIAVGVAFLPLQRGGRRFVDWLFYGRRADRWDTLQTLSARLGTVMPPEDLTRTLVTDLVHALHLRSAFVLRRNDRGDFVLWASDSRETAGMHEEPVETICLSAGQVAAALGSPARSLLLIHAKPLTPGRRKSVPERFMPLDALNSALTVPLVTRSGLESMLCLQPKLSHDAFRSDDLELLAPIVRQAAVALDNALLFARLEKKIGELREAYVRVAHEQETERARLARELHDGTAQELAGLITLATVAGRQLAASVAAPDPVRSTLDRLKLRAEEAYEGVRRASHALRPPMLDDFGLAAALGRYVDEYEEATGIAVDRAVEEVGALGPDAELALFRVAQEGLENVRKHSGATTARLALSRANGRIELMIHDSGGEGSPEDAGAVDEQDGGIGLAGMRERVEAIGGRLTLTRGDGFEVRAVVPAGSERQDRAEPGEDRT
jgi:signal transduction histidine kinase